MSAPNGRFWTRYYVESQARLAARRATAVEREPKHRCATLACENWIKRGRFCADCLWDRRLAIQRCERGSK
jgi:hypothetical protein